MLSILSLSHCFVFISDCKDTNIILIGKIILPVARRGGAFLSAEFFLGIN